MDRRWKDRLKIEPPSPAKAEGLYPAVSPRTALDAMRERESSQKAPESRADVQVMRASAPAICAEQAPHRAIEGASKTPAPVAGLGVLFGQSVYSSSAPSDPTLEANPGVQDESNKDESNKQQEQLNDWHVQGPQQEASVASELAQSSDALFKDGEYIAAGRGDVKEASTDFCAVATASSSFESSSSSSSLHKESAISTNVLHTSTPPARGGRCRAESTSIKDATGRTHHSVPFVTSLCSGRQHL